MTKRKFLCVIDQVREVANGPPQLIPLLDSIRYDRAIAIPIKWYFHIIHRLHQDMDDLDAEMLLRKYVKWWNEEMQGETDA